MHGPTNNSRRRRSLRRTPRRGSVLILVVSVLVLLAVSAAVYVSVGQQERVAAAAGEMKLHREAVSAKVVDYLGQILAKDPFGNDSAAKKPFQDRIADLGFGDFIVPERWDYPYTRPGSLDVFDILADPWLADVEPVDTDGDGVWDRWRHISNIHPQGKFVLIENFFSRRRSLGGNSAFYSDLYITGGNSSPYALDTFTGGLEFDYNIQISEIGRRRFGQGSDDFVTWADRSAGADTDGDGRIDARWTELLDVYGLPKEMRIFVAARIIDASALLNMNANFELGANADNDTSPRIALGRTPADIDLYTYLFDGFNAWGGASNEQTFVEGAGVSIGGPFGFKEHIFQTGIQERFLGGSTYSYQNRSTRESRENFWNAFARRPDQPGAGLMPYGVADEIELRTFGFMGNDRAVSRLESNFDGLNIDPGDYLTWHNPLRSRMNTAGFGNRDYWEKVDYSQGTPTLLALQNDYRHLLTTYNGSRPVRPWSLGYSDTDSPTTLPNLNALLSQVQPTTAQTLAGAFMWALAPYAVDVGNADGSDRGLNVYDTNVVWQPTGSNESLHYGDGDAGYALLKSAQLAVNAMDYYDQGSGPTIRTLVFNRDYTVPNDPTREGKEIIGAFEYGNVPLQMPGPSGDQKDATITVIGLERQPFIREVCAVNVYGDIDGNNFWDWSEDPQEWMVKILAIELGNPWPHAISTSGYRVRFGDDPQNSWAVPSATIPPGESVVVYVGSDNPLNPPQPNGRAAWESIVIARDPSRPVLRIGDDATYLSFEGVSGEFDEVTLWRTATYGQPGILSQVLVDRIRPATSNNDFPNTIQEFDRILIPPPNVDTEFTVMVGSIRRYCDTALSGTVASFPGYVFQSPVAIATGGGRERNGDHLQDRIDSLGLDVPSILISGGLDPQVEYINHNNDVKGYTQEPAFATFQLHVGDLRDNSDSTDKDFRSSVDLLLLSTVGHLHCQQITGGQDPNFAEKGYYVTASELLGDESLRGRLSQDLANVGVTNVPVLLDIIRPAGPSVGGAIFPPDFRNDVNGSPNRFVGRLDFTRFIPRSNNVAMVTGALPLATRVLDAFDVVSVDGNVPLAQGRININTAPRPVLEALPFLHPRFAAGPVPQRDPNLRLAESLRAYRDQGSLEMQSVDWSSGPRHTVSNLLVGNNSGLRDDATTRGVAGFTPGFTSTGELLLATKWAPINGGPSYGVDPSVALSESAYLTGHDVQPLSYEPLNPNGVATPDPNWNFDPTDDPSEHLALIRAIRNAVSTRSDVFIAYFTIVGFTPDDIRRADDMSNSLAGKLTHLRASMEQRYIVVFDRSSVSSPTDRPRVLFAAQEVPSR